MFTILSKGLNFKLTNLCILYSLGLYNFVIINYCGVKVQGVMIL